jgi:ligand-binding sensor domain-containing protein
MRYWFFTSILLCKAATAWGQDHSPNYLLEHWTVADGLPSNALTQVRQSADGYIWVGTEEGLARFDGSRFVTFDDANFPDLPQNHIEWLWSASDSTIWIQTIDRQAVHFRNGRFNTYDAEAGLPRGATYIIKASGQIWLNGAERLFRYAEGRLDSVLH